MINPIINVAGHQNHNQNSWNQEVRVPEVIIIFLFKIEAYILWLGS